MIIAFPFAIVKSSSHSLYAKKIQLTLTPHICDNIIADFPKISSSFQNTTLHSNIYDKIPRYDTPGYLFPIPFLRSVHIFPSYCHLLKIYALLVHHTRVSFHMCSFSYIWQKKNPRLRILHTLYQILFHRLR